MSRKVQYTFFVSLLCTVGVFVYPYIQTIDAPNGDGNTEIGYPFIAYSFGGGRCAFDGPEFFGGTRPCPPAWSSWEPIMLDIGFVVGTPLILSLIVYFVQRFARKRKAV